MGKEEFNGVFFIYGSDTHSDNRKGQTRGGFEPNADIIVKNEIIEVYADLPGIKIENLRVYIRENDLIIEGEKDYEKMCNEVRYLIMERGHSSFIKVIRLPFDTSYENCTAKLRDGVLRVRLFKKSF